MDAKPLLFCPMRQQRPLLGEALLGAGGSCALYYAVHAGFAYNYFFIGTVWQGPSSSQWLDSPRNWVGDA